MGAYGGSFSLGCHLSTSNCRKASYRAPAYIQIPVQASVCLLGVYFAPGPVVPHSSFVQKLLLWIQRKQRCDCAENVGCPYRKYSNSSCVRYLVFQLKTHANLFQDKVHACNASFHLSSCVAGRRRRRRGGQPEHEGCSWFCGFCNP